MAFKASDGHQFPSRQRAEKYQSSLGQKGKEDFENAPGGTSWEHDRRMHGPVTEIHQTYDGPGRWKVVAKHGDGYTHESVHPEAFRAHQIQATLLGIDVPPPGIQTQMRAKAHPVGPKENERFRVEDKRVEEDGSET